MTDKFQYKYKAQYTCIACSHVLSDRERCYHDGVCPFCGHVTNGTVCDTDKLSVDTSEIDDVK